MHKLERRWIGIDIAIHAVKRVSAVRLEDHLGLLAGWDYVLNGITKVWKALVNYGSKTLGSFKKGRLSKWAALSLPNARRKAASMGGCGLRAREVVCLEEMILEVKGGKPSIPFVRALAGGRQQRKAVLAGLILLQSPSTKQRRNFERDGGIGGFEVSGTHHSQLQLLTVEEILAGKRFQTPGVDGKASADPVLPMG